MIIICDTYGGLKRKIRLFLKAAFAFDSILKYNLKDNSKVLCNIEIYKTEDYETIFLFFNTFPVNLKLFMCKKYVYIKYVSG